MSALPRIVAAGAGRMGQGIAQVFAYAGYEVSLVDLKTRPDAQTAPFAKTALAQIEKNLRFLASLDVLPDDKIPPIMTRIHFQAEPEADQALSQADFIFEGVPEVLEIKEPALERISQANEQAVIASTTSTMVVTQLADFVHNPARFLNAHWLNPAYLIPLVEVSPGPATARESTASLMTLLKHVGKRPVRCAARPGYIVPRLQAAAMNEAVRMVEEGVASPAEIDEAVRVGFGVRYATMGLIEFIDWGGVDILYYASNYLKDALPDRRFEPPPVIAEMMEDGRRGMREGQGFYDYREMDVAVYQHDMLARFVRLLSHMELLAAPAD